MQLTDREMYAAIEIEINHILRQLRCGTTFCKREMPEIPLYPPQNTETLYQFIINRAQKIGAEKGWLKKNNSIIENKLREAIPLSIDTWYKIKNGTGGHEPETLFYIIFFFRLDEKDAQYFMSLDSKILNPCKEEDRLVLAMIRCGIYGREEFQKARKFFLRPDNAEDIAVSG